MAQSRSIRLEDVLATDELFLNYFNEFLALPTFPEALFFNKNTGWFEIVDGAKQKLSKKIKAAARASQKQPKIYKAVRQHSFANLPVIPLEDEVDLGPEEIDTSLTITTLNKEQGLRWIKDHRFPAFLQSDLYIEYRLAKILSQTNDTDGEKKSNVPIQLDYTPHPIKIRPGDIVEEESEDDSEQLLKNMCVCMGEAHPTETEAFLSKARLLEGTTTTGITTQSRPISSLITPTSDLGSSTDEEISSRLFTPKKVKSVTPRPNDVVCHTTELTARPDVEEPAWKNTTGAQVYVTPVVGNEDGVHQATYLEELERLAAESTLTNQTTHPSENPEVTGDLVFHSVDEMSSVIAGTVLKYMLAEFNRSQPEVYAHHKAVRDLVGEPSLRDYSLTEIDNASCERVLESSQPTNTQVVEASTDTNKNQPRESEVKHLAARVESEDDSVLGSDDDYEEDRDDYFRKNQSKKFYPLDCKKGIDEFKSFLKGTSGEKHWMLWIDIDRARTLGVDNIDMQMYIEDVRDRYHKKGAVYELPLGTKQKLNLVDSSQWTMERLYSLQNSIAEPILVYWAPRYVVKNQIKAYPCDANADYKHQKLVRVSSAKRQMNTHPEPRTSSLLPLRPKSCRPSVRTTQMEIDELYAVPTPKDFVWQPPATVPLPETPTPIGRRRTHAIDSVKVCVDHAAGRKQRKDHEAKTSKAPLHPSLRAKARPHSAGAFNLTSNQTKPSRPRPATASATLLHGRNSLPNMTTQKDYDHKGGDIQSKRSSFSVTEMGNSKTQADDSSSSSDLSEFNGGRRMNALLKALSCEHDSGLFFRRYIEYTKNRVWLSCIKFWESVQEYHKLFYADSLDRYQVSKKSKEIFAHYMTKTSLKFIACPYRTIQNVQNQLNPPYEEVFDEAEIYALEQLLQAWQSMGYQDRQLLREVQTKNIVINLETKPKLVVNLQRKGFLRPGDLQPDEDPMENFEDPVYDESLLEAVPEDFRDFSLDKIIRTAIHLENFRQFLQSHFATMDLSCWMDIEEFRKMDPKLTDEADTKAREIKQKYFNKKYFFGPNSPASREGLDKMMKSVGGWGKIFPDRPNDDLIIGAQEFVRERLSLKWLPMFLASDQFAELIRPSQQMVNVAEALLLNKQRKNQRIMKMLEGGWVSSSKEIIAFRRSLLNPIVSYQFQRFVSIKSDLLENDVLFWRECQKYKHLHHQHTDDSFIVQKINVIINCFIVTNMDPPLQIDISQEQADRIAEKKRELGPYIFREAQLTVFRFLFEHWTEFCAFKSNTATDQILPTVERKRRRAKLRERQRLKELEEQQEKENARRRALGLPIEGEENRELDDPNLETAKKKEDEDDEKSETSEGQQVAWRYSSYMEGLNKENIVNKTSEETFSCLSGEGKETASQEKTDSVEKATIDISDLKDLKAPTAEKPAVPDEEMKPSNTKRKSQNKNENNKKDSMRTKGTSTATGSRNHKSDKKDATHLKSINKALSETLK